MTGGKPASVLVTSSAKPTLKKCRILDSPEIGVQASDAQPTLLDCTVRTAGGLGVVSEGASKLLCRGGMITDCRDGAQGRYGGRLIVEGVELHQIKNVGVSAVEKGRAEVKDCRIHDITVGFGVHAETGGIMTVQGGEVYQIANSGIWANSKSNLTVVDVVIHDAGWEGVTVKGGSEAEIHGCTITGTAACGIGVLQSKARVYSCKISGSKRHGIGLTTDASVFVKECTILDNAAGGISAPDPKAITIADSRIQ